MFSSIEAVKLPNLLDRDWEGILKQLHDGPSRDNGVFYMITLNKGQETEYRTRFLTYDEVLDLVATAVEKKKLRIKIPPAL